MKRPILALRVAAVLSAVGLAALFVLYRSGVFAAPADPPPYRESMISSSKVLKLSPSDPQPSDVPFEVLAGSKSAPVFTPPAAVPPDAGK